MAIPSFRCGIYCDMPFQRFSHAAADVSLGNKHNCLSVKKKFYLNSSAFSNDEKNIKDKCNDNELVDIREHRAWGFFFKTLKNNWMEEITDALFLFSVPAGQYKVQLQAFIFAQ